MGFWERMEKVISQGINSSKDVLEKARDKAKDLGEKGILKFEIMQLEKQAESGFMKLGSKIYELIDNDHLLELLEKYPEIKDVCKEIHEVKIKIEDKEINLKDLSKK